MLFADTQTRNRDMPSWKIVKYKMYVCQEDKMPTKILFASMQMLQIPKTETIKVPVEYI